MFFLCKTVKLTMPLILASVFIAGCATPQPFKYPEYKNTATIIISSETISTTTETPAGDYLIPDSQVFVGKSSNTTISVAGIAFGVIGTLVAISAEKTNNKSSLESHEETFKIKFDEQVSVLIKSAIDKDGHEGKYSVITNGKPDIKVLPSVRFIVEEGIGAEAVFRLDVKVDDKIQGKETKKIYMYFSGSRHKFKEWADDDGFLFKSATEKAFSALVSVFIKDLSGDLAGQSSDANRKVVKYKLNNWVGPGGREGALFLEQPEYIVVAPLHQGKYIRAFSV